MTQDNNKFVDAFEQQRQRNEETLTRIDEELKGIFPDEKQHEAVTELYKQVFKMSYDLEELNRQNILLASFLEGFQENLVGEGKILTEEEYMDASVKAFQNSMEAINKAFETVKAEAEQASTEE